MPGLHYKGKQVKDSSGRRLAQPCQEIEGGWAIKISGGKE